MAQIQPTFIDRKVYTANEGETRNGPGDVPGVQGSDYVTTGTETVIATGARKGVAGQGTVRFYDAVSPGGFVYTVGTFFTIDDNGGNVQFKFWVQTPKTSVDTPLTPGSVLQAIPMPNTNTDGTVIGP